MAKPDAEYREIILSEEITCYSIKPIIESILRINDDDAKNESDYKDWERKPIKLYINSFGGSIYDGFALIDIIKCSKTPVYTIAIGSSMSMGLMIYLSGHKRYIGKYATLMYHELTGYLRDKLNGVKNEVHECGRIQKILDDLITSTSLVSQKTLSGYRNKKSEWYISSEEAINLNLADGYYTT